MNKERKMSRTTELLKGCEKYLKDTKRQIQKLEENGYTEIHDFSKYPDKLLYSAVIVEKKNKIKLYKAKIKSELKGRLDALKEFEDKLKKKVVNELCYCGHSKDCHGKHNLDNHGANCNQCQCKEYTWKEFVKADFSLELASIQEEIKLIEGKI